MNKSVILAEEIKTKEVELLQERVNNNSKLINELTNKLVADYCKQLDEYIRQIDFRLTDYEHPVTIEDLENFALNLPVLLYFCGEAQENLGIKTDIAKAVRQEKYNDVYRNLDSGTISDKTSKAELASQSEEITRIIYDRAYKIVKEKMEAAYELLGSCKKVISRRMSETQLTNMNEYRFNFERRN